jgi:hypothetical protein
MSKSKSLTVAYSQIAVFQTSTISPFNNWTDAHVAQGFAWRPGSASFRTKADSGLHEVMITCSLVNSPSECLRVIEVPFIVSGSEPVMVASIGDNFLINIPEGSYALRFAIAAKDTRRIELAFLKTDAPEFQIFHADPDLSPGEPLLTDAQPA